MEKLEIFNIYINSSLLPEGVFSGNPNNSGVNILDTDGML